MRVVAVGSARFREACATMPKHKDQGYSFTDVTSFIVMREMRLDEVLTDDRHFGKAGFRRLLQGGLRGGGCYDAQNTRKASKKTGARGGTG